MIFETYTTAKGAGMVEYGFTFKTHTGDGDSLFDLVLGEVKWDDRTGDNGVIAKAWREYEWAAQAIVGNQPRKYLPRVSRAEWTLRREANSWCACDACWNLYAYDNVKGASA